jgi:hypothetical protein
MLRSSFAGLRVRRGMKGGVSSIVKWTGLIPELKERQTSDPMRGSATLQALGPAPDTRCPLDRGYWQECDVSGVLSVLHWSVHRFFVLFSGARISACEGRGKCCQTVFCHIKGKTEAFVDGPRRPRCRCHVEHVFRAAAPGEG